MAGIVPIPSTRVSDSLLHARMLNQLQSDQIDLMRLQQQIATGRRISFASEDAPAALRAIALQKLIEQKSQIQTNISTSQSFLSASDNALGSASNLLNEARALAISAADTISTPSQRETAATQIDRILQQFLQIGNQNFRGRYLFAGSSSSTAPFAADGTYVMYNGNESLFQTFSDLDQVFATNVPGSTVFGAISQPVRGSVDLNPAITRETKLADLNGGKGVALGSIAISDGTNKQIIDLSRASTVGDVMDMIEANPPLGRVLTVTLSDRGLNVALDPQPGTNLRIEETGNGTTARDLGILYASGAPSDSVTGSDLQPLLTLTTKLGDLFGKRAETSIKSSPGSNNDIILQANRRGSDYDGYTVNFLDDPAVTAGNELVFYDTNAKTITVHVDTGFTTATQVINAINNSPVGADFTAKLDSREPNNNGTGLISLSATGTTAGGTGIEFDQNSGLQIFNGDTNYTIDLSSARTVEDVLNILNESQAGLIATINSTGTGIDVRSRLSGGNFAIGENGGATATQLGLRTFTETSRLESLNLGLGIHNSQGVDFVIERKDGALLRIDVAGAQTIGDVIDLINHYPNNQDPNFAVFARLNTTGNGIELYTDDNTSTGTLAVRVEGGSTVAEELGLVAKGQSVSDPAVVSGSRSTLSGRDVNQGEVESVFTALKKLSEAIRAGDLPQITRTTELLDKTAEALSFARSEIGARQQILEGTTDRLENELIELKASLSNDIEVDIAEAISNLSARMAAYQASLQMTAQATRLSLLDYL